MFRIGEFSRLAHARSGSCELELSQGRLRRLEQEIERVGEPSVPNDVLLRHLPELDIVSARKRLGGLHAAQGFAQELLREAPKALRRSMGRLIVIQCAQEFEPDALDLEIGLTLEGGEWDGHAPHVAGERLERRRLPAIESAAVCVRVGPPEEVHQQSQALARCIEEEGLQIAGPNREVFLRPPTPAAPPIIEMQFPVVRLS